ncbi:Hc38 [Aphelenchoides avenae]|nr:Hc38 [Aphelenchus avenae]
MSANQMRRLLKEKDKDLFKAEKLESESEDESNAKPRLNKFAFLDEGADSGSISESADQAANVDAPQTKAKKKKNKKKAAKTVAAQRTDDDDVDKALSAIASSNGKENADTGVTAMEASLLKVDVRNLNADNELKRLLGKTFGAAATGNTRQTRVHRAGGRVVKAKPHWAPLRQTGLLMVLEREEPTAKWYRFQHSSQYRYLQQLFWMHQRAMDHETILNQILVENPYHLDSLLLCAEVMRIQEDFQNSRDTIERGLFACESAFCSGFQLLSPECRISYNRRENRAFFLLLTRHLQHMCQRRCFFTALQFAKIIFMKDPVDDPLAIVLLVDTIALKAKEYQYVIHFYDCFKGQRNLDMLPNFLYSVALSHFFLSSQDDDQRAKLAETCLEEALVRFPFVLGQILDRMQVKPDSAVDNNSYLNEIAFHRETDGSKLLTSIYLYHSLELWKMPEVLAWLERTTHAILPRLANARKKELDEWAEKRKRTFVGMPSNILRHALVFEVRQNEDGDNIVDPAPPRQTQADYEPENFDESAVARGDSSNAALEFLLHILPEEHQHHVHELGGVVRDATGTARERFMEMFNVFTNRLRLTRVEEDHVLLTYDVDSTNDEEDAADGPPEAGEAVQSSSRPDEPPSEGSRPEDSDTHDADGSPQDGNRS